MLVARYAAGDAYPTETDEAARLVAECDQCAALAADIRLIADRTASLPQAKRPRDFRISSEQADKLRGSWFDRLMRGLSAPGWSVVRPLAAASLAIGIVMVVVGALPLAFRAGSAAAPANYSTGDRTASQAATDAALGAATVAPAQAPVASSADAYVPLPETNSGSAGGASLPPQDNVAGAPQTQAAQTQAPPPPKAASSIAAPGESAQGYVSGPAAAPSGTDEMEPSVPTAAPVAAPAASPTSWLVPLGLILAFGALIALALVALARRRYSDPLVR